MLPLLLTLATLAPQDDARGWGPEQATGAPDTATAGDNQTAWASRRRNGSSEWLELRYPEAVTPVGVRVFETFNPGALVQVVAIDADGADHVAWKGTDPGVGDQDVVVLPLAVGVPIQRLRLELDCSRVRGWNEIDAVGLHDTEGRLWWASSATASSTFAQAEAPSVLRELPPVTTLDPSWATRADGLLELYGKARASGAEAEFVTALAEEVLLAQSDESRVAPTFAGRWDTSFGPMNLTVEGEVISGTYAAGSIEGKLEEVRLVFRFTEADVAGDGWFELATDGQSFAGQWHNDGVTSLSAWRGTRMAEVQTDVTWLVVFEAPWEHGLADTPYAFGGMLEAIFSHKSNVRVRRRSYTDATSFENWARQLAWLDGEVILVVATHATSKGLQSQDGLIPPEVVAKALAGASNLRLVHFSACEAMAGDMPKLVNEACGKHETFAGVSGYDISVDWMGSALTEFTYLDLLLGRRLEPAKAADELLKLLEFAGDTVRPASAIPASHFRFEAPTRSEAPVPAGG